MTLAIVLNEFAHPTEGDIAVAARELLEERRTVIARSLATIKSARQELRSERFKMFPTNVKALSRVLREYHGRSGGRNDIGRVTRVGIHHELVRYIRARDAYNHPDAQRSREWMSCGLQDAEWAVQQYRLAMITILTYILENKLV